LNYLQIIAHTTLKEYVIMIKNLCLSILLITIGVNMSITSFFNQVSQISIFCNNQQIIVDNSEKIEIIESLKEITNNAHEMPAYGVAIDHEVRDAMRLGLWLELNFNNTMTHEGMTFDNLLINIDPEASGFNLIRQHDGIYEGRCYYLSLDNTMEKLYNAIISIIK